MAISLKKFYVKEFYVIDNDKGYEYEDNSFDFIFNYACFEHIPNIDFILKEVIRVLKNGGYILFRPAWNVRLWASKGYSVRSYSELNLIEKWVNFYYQLEKIIFFEQFKFYLLDFFI